ncbi:unnamed protein product [Pleuronectes platessa]|uniref:Uncharacterized protein n=1 Tax=Pleuronectes platessa TaxID=8262 RepID=A0A9N7YJ60_PLEPL|nr:unnamed protein product [Pleuronectes platessa]
MLINASRTNYLTGLVASGAAVLRDPSSKWYVPVEVHPSPQYPRYALGLRLPPGHPLTDPGPGYFYVFPVSYNRCAFSRLIATTTHENADRTSIWTDFKNQARSADVFTLSRTNLIELVLVR